MFNILNINNIWFLARRIPGWSICCGILWLFMSYNDWWWSFRDPLWGWSCEVFYQAGATRIEVCQHSEGDCFGFY